MKHLIHRRTRLVIASVAALAILPGLAVAPAVAAVTQSEAGSSICTDEGTGSAARGGDKREPAQKHSAVEVASTIEAAQAFSATVPVYFHVVHDGSAGSNVTRAQIDKQIDVLNKTYAGAEGGSKAGFTFKIVDVDRTKNATWFKAGPDSKGEAAMKKALHKGALNALNFYSTTAGDYLGWATFPTRNPAELYLDGVVVDWESMVGTSTTYAGKYDEGKTGTHEVGHWINLYHVFQDGCTGKGDRVDDTPKQSTASEGCPTGQDSCTKAPGLDSIHNYMDYSFDSCYSNFTAGQVRRMHDAWRTLRASA